MTITEFASSRGIQTQTVSIYIKRHSKDFKGHTLKKGKAVELDSTALELLDKIYPLPNPIQIIEDTESRKELIQAQKQIIRLQEQLQEATRQIAQAEAIKLLLEDKKEQLTKSEYRINELEKALEIEKAKTWWDKLRHK